MIDKLPLRDIHLPDPVFWWPPALGWWLLAALLLLSAALAYRLQRHARAARHRRRLCREALRELDVIEHRLAARREAGEAMEAVSVLLRRVAVTVVTDERVAGISGAAWVEWLHRNGPRGLDPAALQPLADAPYRPRPDVAAAPVIEAARQWVQHASRRLEAGS